MSASVFIATIRLEHIGTRSYPSGLVQSEYAIAL
jgi:hypothetical protein